MEDIGDEIDKNCLILVVCLKYTVNGLLDCIQTGIGDLYDKLDRKVQSISKTKCSTNCSRKSIDLKRWCMTCSTWRKEILQYVRYSSFKQNIKWENFDSEILSGDNKEKAKSELASVFIKKEGSSISPFNFDLQSSLSVFHNCRYFDIGEKPALINSVRDIRNKYFAHSSHFTVNNKDLKQCMRTLKRLLNHSTFKSSHKCKEAVLKLDHLLTDSQMNNPDVTRLEKYICSELSDCTQNRVSNNLIPVKMIIEDYLYSEYVDDFGTCKLSSSARKWSIVILSLLVIVVAYMLQHLERIKDKQDCKLMEFGHPFENAYNFDFYISEHDKFVGRNWLLNKLDDLMNSSERGVLFLAEPGYGKTALMAKLICQNDKIKPGYFIHEHLIAYHFCSYDSVKTIEPGILIRNLAGGFAQKIREFSRIINNDEISKRYLESNQCIDDPEGCLDTVVLKTLRKIKPPITPFIVIVDALDECIETRPRNILFLIETRFLRYPDIAKFVKFLFTSRKMYSTFSKLQVGFSFLEQDSESVKNMEDAELFLLDELKDTHFYNRMVEVSKSSNHNYIAKKAAKHCKGNMQFLTHAVRFWSTTDVSSLDETPNTLNQLYKRDIERAFEWCPEKFEKVKNVLEILCTTVEPQTIDNVLEIANISQELEKKTILRIIQEELSHFLRIRDKISISHRSLSEFFTNNQRNLSNYFVSKKNGSILWAEYWIGKMKRRTSFNNLNMLKVLEYVVNSKSTKIESAFLKTGKHYVKTSPEIFSLHEAAVRINSYQGMQLFLNLTEQSTLDQKDEGNVTASFLAAAFGNHESLRFLLDNGADINFVRQEPKSIIVNQSVDIVHFCTHTAFWKYNLLNIASQNGHAHVVKLLLKRNINIYHKNAVGLDSFHLASMLGQKEILEIFLLSYTFSSSWNHSLYLSAKHGHTNVVKMLLYHGAIDSCLPCNGQRYWIKLGKTRFQNAIKINYTTLIDDWKYIKCETALEASIRNGHLNVVKILLNKTQDTLKCREAGGKTPILTAVMYGKLEIFKFLLSNYPYLKEDRCLKKQPYKDLDLNENELKMYKSNICPFNISIYHLIAMYNRQRMLQYTNENSESEWDVKDSFGANPLHYASCHGHKPLVKTLQKYGLTIYDKTLNGSSPIHSSASCGQYRMMINLLKKSKDIPLDLNGRSVFHYMAMREVFHNQQTVSVMKTDIFDNDAMNELFENHITMKDSFGKTPLHYAAETGNIKILQLYFSLNLGNSTWGKILSSLDYNKRTPIDLAFENLPTFKPAENLKFFPYCNDLENNCITFRKQTYTAREFFIWSIFNTRLLRKQNHNLTKYIAISMEKQNFHTVSFLKKRNSLYSGESFKVHIPDITFGFNHINPYLITRRVVFEKELCTEPFKTNILHSIMEDKKREFWVWDFEISLSIHRKILDNCYDNEGFNPLHRAVIGRNSKGFQYLINKGMSLKTRSKSGKDILQLLVENTPPFREQHKKQNQKITELTKDKSNHFQINYSLYVSTYDAIEIAETIIRRTNLLNLYTKDFICKSNSNALSFVHLLAAKGFGNILSQLKKMFGENILHCENADGFTPYFLSYFFAHTSAIIEVNVTKKGNGKGWGKLQLPLWSSYLSLLLRLYTNFRSAFPPLKSANLMCFVKLKRFRNHIQILKCAGYAYRRRVLLKQIVFDDMDKTNCIKQAKCIKKHLEEAETLKKEGKRFGDKYLRKYFSMLKTLKTKNCLNPKLNLETSKNWSAQCIEKISVIKKLVYKAEKRYHFENCIIYFISSVLYSGEIQLPFEMIPNNRSHWENLVSPFVNKMCEQKILLKFQYLNVFYHEHSKSYEKMMTKIQQASFLEIATWDSKYRGSCTFPISDNTEDPFKKYEHDFNDKT